MFFNLLPPAGTPSYQEGEFFCFRGPVIPTLPEGSLPVYCPLVLGGREACLGGGDVRVMFFLPDTACRVPTVGGCTAFLWAGRPRSPTLALPHREGIVTGGGAILFALYTNMSTCQNRPNRASWRTFRRITKLLFPFNAT